MINDPELEPYFVQLVALGYRPFNYSEKHYLFFKGDHILKIARKTYNNFNTDESYYIEARANKILSEYRFAVANINRIYEKGEIVDGFIALEEEKIDGEVYYRKDSDSNVLRQVIEYMNNATAIKGSTFGMMNNRGSADHVSWKDFLVSVILKFRENERGTLLREIECVPENVEASFVFTDCNISNFIFESDKLKCAIDIERPMWGDKDFLFGMIKIRNKYMYELAVNEGYVQDSKIIDFYSKIYSHIFD